MGAFLENQLPTIRFVYGLIFFTLGMGIIMQPRRNSVYFLASSLSLLAAFGLVHAFADWGLVILPLQERFFTGETMEQLLKVRTFAVLLSFGLLMQFGLTLSLENHPRLLWLQMVPAAYTAFFLVALLVSQQATEGLPWWLVDMKVAGRYFLGFPASMLSAWGLIKQAAVFKRDGLTRHLWYLYGAVICFVLYAIAGGLIVPARDFFPANLLNDRFVLQTWGIPVEILRAGAILGVTCFMLKLLGIFHLESQRRLQAVEQDRALLREREQIARHLHDGIMQTLYGTGLGLKQVCSLAESKPEQAHAILQELDREIGRSIVRMRQYVLDLKEETISAQEMAATVQNLALETGQFAGIAIDVECDATDGRIPAGLREEVLGVMREALSNVVRHADATQARVVFSLEDETLLLRVSDNGRGFDAETAVPGGRSLQGLRERIEALGGYLQVLSGEGMGAQVVAHLPLSSGRTARRREREA